MSHPLCKTIRRRLILVLFPALCVTALAQSSTAQKPFTAANWATIHSAAAAAVSPQGTILYAVSFGAPAGSTQYQWWTIDAASKAQQQLSLPKGFSPIGFTRDGSRLYGTWKVNGQPQFAIFPLADGKAPSVPAVTVLLPRGVEGALPSPDGKRFALVADPRPPDPLDKIRHIQQPSQASLYVVNADGTGGQWWCPALRQIAGAPTVGGASGAIAWNPDNATLAVLSSLPKIGYKKVASSIDRCSASGVQPVANIPNSISGLAWAADGHTLAFISTKSAVLTPEHVWTVDTRGGAPTDRTPSLDGTALQISRDPAGHLWVLVDRGVQTEVDAFADNTLTPRYKWPAGVLSGTPVTAEYPGASTQMAFTVGDPAHSRNVAVPQGTSLVKITHAGDKELGALQLANVRTVHWKSRDGIALEGIATFPPGYTAGHRYPFLVLPHGGPEANDELSFDPLSQIIAGWGYVVLQPQYRGSTGFGADFLAAIYQHFGDRAYQDVDSATDFAIAQGWADPHRLAIFGWSAGGFMTAWTVTQTGRYRAAIEGAGITDWSPFMWTSDIQQIDYDARWTDTDYEAFRKFSAVAFASQVTTPLLILHGEADHRVPTFQGTEYFEILAARGKTVRMVSYPGSPHFPILWEQRLNVMHEIHDWLNKYNTP
jgi:dipeptidyl aminopeptidase/acylaminoacyl peptidase